MTKTKKLILGIGPPKCGTTSLYFSLVATSQVSSSKLKEPRFFSNYQESTKEGIPHGLELNGNYKNGIDWYRSLFQNECEYHIDFTTYYSILRDVPEYVKKHYDEVYIVCVLREPVERFISHYYQYTKVGIDMPSIENIVFEDSILSRFMFSFSEYEETLNRYKNEFGEEKILLLDFNDLKDNHAMIQSEVSSFLQLKDFIYVPNTQSKNAAGVPRNKFVSRLIFSKNLRRITKFFPPALKVKGLNVRKMILRKNIKISTYEMPSEMVMKELRRKLAGSIHYYNEAFSRGEKR